MISWPKISSSGSGSAEKHVLHIPGQQSKSERDAQSAKKRKYVEKIERREHEKKRRRHEREGKEKYDSKELFKNLRTQVNSLGASKFRGWDKNEWMEKQKKAMGMKAEKHQKVPYRIMKGIQRKQIAKKKKYELEAKAADVVLGKKKQKKKGGRFAIKGGPKQKRNY